MYAFQMRTWTRTGVSNHFSFGFSPKYGNTSRIPSLHWSQSIFISFQSKIFFLKLCSSKQKFASWAKCDIYDTFKDMKQIESFSYKLSNNVRINWDKFFLYNWSSLNILVSCIRFIMIEHYYHTMELSENIGLIGHNRYNLKQFFRERA